MDVCFLLAACSLEWVTKDCPECFYVFFWFKGIKFGHCCLGSAGFSISLNYQQKLGRGHGVQMFEINGIAQVSKQWQNRKLFLVENVISPFQIFSLTVALTSIILCWEYSILTRFTVISSFLSSNRKKEGLFKSLSCYLEIFNIEASHLSADALHWLQHLNNSNTLKCLEMNSFFPPSFISGKSLQRKSAVFPS